MAFPGASAAVMFALWLGPGGCCRVLGGTAGRHAAGAWRLCPRHLTRPRGPHPSTKHTLGILAHDEVSFRMAAVFTGGEGGRLHSENRVSVLAHPKHTAVAACDIVVSQVQSKTA